MIIMRRILALSSGASRSNMRMSTRTWAQRSLRHPSGSSLTVAALAIVVAFCFGPALARAASPMAVGDARPAPASVSVATADSAPPPAGRAATPAAASASSAPASPAAGQGYAAREARARSLEAFKGGDTTIVVGGSLLLVVLVVVLILILI
jgi:hypothetical protein